MSSFSVACGLMRVQMSMVNRVLLLLKMEAKEDMRAANITANMRPRKPAKRQWERKLREEQRMERRAEEKMVEKAQRLEVVRNVG